MKFCLPLSLQVYLGHLSTLKHRFVAELPSLRSPKWHFSTWRLVAIGAGKGAHRNGMKRAIEAEGEKPDD